MIEHFDGFIYSHGATVRLTPWEKEKSPLDIPTHFIDTLTSHILRTLFHIFHSDSNFPYLYMIHWAELRRKICWKTYVKHLLFFSCSSLTNRSRWHQHSIVFRCKKKKKTYIKDESISTVSNSIFRFKLPSRFHKLIFRLYWHDAPTDSKSNNCTEKFWSLHWKSHFRILWSNSKPYEKEKKNFVTSTLIDSKLKNEIIEVMTINLNL